MPLDQTGLLIELEPVVAANLDRHLSLAKEWFPHEYVPWSEGRTYDGLLGGEPWREDDSDLPDVARTALIVNLLTEDNLPSYHHEIATLFGRDGAWGTWVHRWTAEEGRHGIAIRDYLTVTSAVDRSRGARPEITCRGVRETPTTSAALHRVRRVPGTGPRISHRTPARRPVPIAEQCCPGRGGRENAHEFYRI